MTDKKVYAWACKITGTSTYVISTGDETGIYSDIKPLYSIEEVRHVIENNELPKRPVATVCWDNNDLYKRAYQGAETGSVPCDNEVPVYSEDELLAELQKEI